MAFRTGNIVADAAYKTVKSAAYTLKVNTEAYIAQMAAQDTNYTTLRDIFRMLQRADAQFDELKTTPGIVDWAKQMEDDPAYDLAAKFTAMQAAITSAGAWMNNDTNIPRTNRTLAPFTAWGDLDIPVTQTFTPAQTAPLRTELQAVADSIVIVGA